MFFNLTKQSIAKIFVVSIFIVLCSGITSFAQSVIAQPTLPTDCRFTLNPNSTNTGFSALNTMIAANTTTNRIYAPLDCGLNNPNGGTPGLLEINGADNSQRIIDLQLSGSEPYGVWGITVDSQRNRVYIPVQGVFNSNALLVFDANTNSKQIFPIPSMYDELPTGELVINPNTNRVYIPKTFGAISIFNANDNSWDRIEPFPLYGILLGVAIDATRNRLYVTSVAEYPFKVIVIDLNNNTVIERIPIPRDCNLFSTDCFILSGSVAVNPVTNRIYLPGVSYANNNATGTYPSILVINGADYSSEMTAIPNPSNRQFDDYQYYGNVFVNPRTNRVYTYFSNNALNSGLFLATLDGSTNVITGKTIEDAFFKAPHSAVINPETNLLYIPNTYEDYLHSVTVIDPASSGIISQSNPVVQADSATLNFSNANLTGSGTVSVPPISDPAVAGDIPGGFAISDEFAFEIHPDENLVFNGPVTSCFKIPTINNEAEFNALAVLHREETSPGVFGLVDRTSSHDFATRTICAATTSFSPFYIARKANKIKWLFDKSKAYKSGSTVPVKVQLLNSNNINISADTTALSMRGLRLIGSNTTTSVVDSGNANADSNFRYLGGTSGGSYIFNLSTKGLAAGRYVLSFYEGSNRAFFYTVEFEVK